MRREPLRTPDPPYTPHEAVSAAIRQIKDLMRDGSDEDSAIRVVATRNRLKEHRLRELYAFYTKE